MRFPSCLCNTKYNLWYSSREHLLVKEKLDFQSFRITSFSSYSTRTSQLDSVPPQSWELHISSICIWLLLQSSWLQTGDCYCGRTSQTLKNWIPMISVATGRNRKKNRWINPFKRLPVQSTTPQPSQKELCLRTSCSARSRRACGNIPELNYPKHWEFFLIFYLCSSCCSWSPLFPCLQKVQGHIVPLLFASALHTFGNLFCLSSVPSSGHTLLSLSFTSMANVLHLQPLFRHLFGLFSYAFWHMEIVLEPRPLPSEMKRLSHVFCNVPLRTGIPGEFLDFCSTGFVLYSQASQSWILSPWQKPGQLLFILHLRNWF